MPIIDSIYLFIVDLLSVWLSTKREEEKDEMEKEERK